MTGNNTLPAALLVGLLVYFVKTAQSYSHIRTPPLSPHKRQNHQKHPNYNGQHRKPWDQCKRHSITSLEAASTSQESESQSKPTRPRRGGLRASKPSKSNGAQDPRPPKQQRRRQNSTRKKSGAFNPCPSRELNHQIVQQNNALELLGLLASTKSALSNVGGGGTMNSVNFSTALHRIARHLHNKNHNQDKNEGNNRSKVLTDPRFALLVCSAAEALLGDEDIRDARNQRVLFGSREMSNVAWAIAKLKIAPPINVMPVDMSSNSEILLSAKSKQVRSMVYNVAKERAARAHNIKSSPAPSWIPALSELCGLLMDTISYRVTKVGMTKCRSQEWSNLLWALATAQRASDEAFNSVISNLITGMKGVSNSNGEGDLRPQEWSNSIWALATSGIVGPEEELLPFVAGLMDSHSDFLISFKPQELSNTVWGVATILSKRPGQPEGQTGDAALRILRQAARQLIERQGESYKSQELTNSIWAFATLGFGLSTHMSLEKPSTVSDYTFLHSDESDRILMAEAIRVATRKAKGNLRHFRSQELNNIAWTMARLDQKDEDLLDEIGMELCDPRRKVSSQDIGTSLWSFATLEYVNKDLYRTIAARVTTDKARYSKPQEISNVVWALATADMVPKFIDVFDTTILPQGVRPSLTQAQEDPVTMCFAIASQELMRRTHEFKPQEIKDILWSLSRVRMRHPILFKSVAEYLVGASDDPEMTGRGLVDFSAQGLGNLAWAYARQAQLGAEVLSRFEGDTIVPKSSGRLAQYISSYMDLGEDLLQKFFHCIAETDLGVHENMSKLKPQDLSNSAWAFAILGMKHTPFLAAVVDQLLDRTQRYLNGDHQDMNRFKGQELTNALWALATLNYTPSQDLLHQLEPYLVEVMATKSKGVTVNSILRYLNRQELANLAWVCAVFGEYPTELISLVYKGLLGVGENADPVYMQKVHRDAGIQPSAVMSMLYLQIVMDLEQGNGDGFSLPGNFPESWDSGSSPSSRVGDSTIENNFELRLTRSKLQQTVSQAFERIGFPHIEEHVIGMDTLSRENGIQMVSCNRDILSLDLANVESRIGIEVDGPGHFVTTIDGGLCLSGETASIGGKVDYRFYWDSEHQEINGSTALKLRILRELGWLVISIPFWEWYDMEGNAQQQQDYCRSVLPSSY